LVASAGTLWARKPSGERRSSPACGASWGKWLSRIPLGVTRRPGLPDHRFAVDGDHGRSVPLVSLWVIVMIFALPLVAELLRLPAGIGGAWIGTSEFADAAGFAAAQTYGGMAGPDTGIAGTADQAVWSYTLVKVVGRDVWIGIWAFVLSIIAVTRWDVGETGGRAEVGQIWWRFPKFVIGFLLASILVTLVCGACPSPITTRWPNRSWSRRSIRCASGFSLSASSASA
jgi:hypothetical protein